MTPACVCRIFFLVFSGHRLSFVPKKVISCHQSSTQKGCQNAEEDFCFSVRKRSSRGVAALTAHTQTSREGPQGWSVVTFEMSFQVRRARHLTPPVSLSPHARACFADVNRLVFFFFVPFSHPEIKPKMSPLSRKVN